MAKALHCSLCNSIISLKPDSSLTSCYCGTVEGWYRDPELGSAVLHVNDPDQSVGIIISFHNGYLNDGPKMIPKSYYDMNTQQQIPYGDAQLDTFWQHLHAQVYTPKAPEAVRIFDPSRRACPMALIEPGTTSDTQWATPEEWRAKKKT